MVLIEYAHTFVQQVILIVINKGSAYAQSLLTATCRVKCNGAYSIIKQFFGQILSAKTRIAYREIKNVSADLVI